MIKFKPALDTLQTEIAGRERQGIKPIPVTRRTLYRQATVNTTSVTHKEPERVTHTVNNQPVNTVNTANVNNGTHSVTETGTHKPVTDKPAKKKKVTDKVQTIESHTSETSDADDAKAKADRKEYYRKYMAERREAAKRTDKA